MTQSTAIYPTQLVEDILADHGFCAEDYEEFTSNDTPVAKHRGYTIALSIPNGGILGVSFYKRSTDECYSRLTSCEDDFPGYAAEKEHIAFAKKAIDAAWPQPVADQLCLGVESC